MASVNISFEGMPSTVILVKVSSRKSSSNQMGFKVLVMPSLSIKVCNGNRQTGSQKVVKVVKSLRFPSHLCRTQLSDAE